MNIMQIYIRDGKLSKKYPDKSYNISDTRGICRLFCGIFFYHCEISPVYWLGFTPYCAWKHFEK